MGGGNGVWVLEWASVSSRSLRPSPLYLALPPSVPRFLAPSVPRTSPHIEDLTSGLTRILPLLLHRLTFSTSLPSPQPTSDKISACLWTATAAAAVAAADHPNRGLAGSGTPGGRAAANDDRPEAACGLRCGGQPAPKLGPGPGRRARTGGPSQKLSLPSGEWATVDRGEGGDTCRARAYYTSVCV